MAKTILTTIQQKLLQLLFANKDFVNQFYLTGGTALSEYYLHHRLSEDLDFFALNEFDVMSIQTILKSITPQVGIQKIDFQQSFNRNLFFLHFEDEVVKTEFTHYPFQQIVEPRVINMVKVDSLIDIAVNKAFTIYQNPRSRDFIDVYLIIQEKKWTFPELAKKARIKFDTHIDPLQMAQQLLKVTEVKDYPHMITNLDPKTWQDFWLEETKRLKEDVLEP